MLISELFDMEELETEIKEGYVRKTLHPTLPLAILNYTEKATFDRRWNQVTRHCRGLIYRQGSGELIARGPVKFFNYGEPSAVDYPLDTPVRVSRKEDGSLGIGWYWEDTTSDDWHWGLATRGSFTSPQALHATELVKLNKDDIGHYEIMSESLEDYHKHNGSYIGEIVFPENRIVLDYKGKDAVIPLGIVNNLTGVVEWRPWGYNGWDDSITTLAEVLSRPIPDDEEGYVLDILDEKGEVIDHLKLKGDKYKEMHAAIFHLTEKSVWEAWRNDGVSELVESLPDELHDWVLAVDKRLDAEWTAISERARKAFDDAYNYSLEHDENGNYSRSLFAQYVMFHHKDISAVLFATMDDNFIKRTEIIDKLVKPAHVPYAVYSTTDA